MKSVTRCQLLLPGMFHELALTTLCPPALGKLLRSARRGAHFSGNDQAWRCHYFGVARQQDDPVAPFSCLGEGIECGPYYWLCANPVNLQLQRDSFVLADGQMRGLSLEQAGQLVAALNQHFLACGMRFYAPHANRWYLRLLDVPRMETHPLPEVLGRSIHRLLPHGEDGLRWHQRLNEIQMLLHEHPVNLDLEHGGNLPVNSLWLWGGGVLLPGLAQPELQVWAQDSFTRGLAQAHGSRVMGLPRSAIDWLRQGLVTGKHLLVLNGLEQADLQSGAGEWADTLARMDNEWFTPLLAALRDGTLDRLDLHLAGTRKVNSYSLSRTDLYKFWRRARPLGAWLA